MDKLYYHALETVFRQSYMSIVDMNTETQEVVIYSAVQEGKLVKNYHLPYSQISRYMQTYHLHPDDCSIFDEIIEDNNLFHMSIHKEHRYSYIFRMKLLPTDTVYIWVKVCVLVIENLKHGYHISCCFENIDEFMKQQYNQQLKHQYYMTALRHAFEEIYEIDLNHGVYYSMNVNHINEQHSTNEYFYNDMLTVIISHIHPEDAELCKKSLQIEDILQHFNEGIKAYAFECRIKDKKNKPYRWLSARIMEMEHTEQSRALMLVKDVTEERAVMDLKMKVDLLQSQMQAQVRYYQYIEEMEQKIRSLRHDMKNHLLILENLYNENDREQFSSYVEMIRGFMLKGDETYITTGNQILNALLNEKIAYAKTLNIEVKTDVRIQSEFTLSALDICALFGNALDNAIEANEKISDVSLRKLELHLVSAANVLAFSCINAIDDDSSKTRLDFMTTKEEKEHHGLGIYNMKKIAKKYHGEFDLYQENKQVILKISLLFQKEENK